MVAMGSMDGPTRQTADGDWAPASCKLSDIGDIEFLIDVASKQPASSGSGSGSTALNYIYVLIHAQLSSAQH